MTACAVFGRLGFRDTCDNCSIETVARRQDQPTVDVIDAFNAAILPKAGSPQ
jgi:hypothetical protein